MPDRNALLHIPSLISATLTSPLDTKLANTYINPHCMSVLLVIHILFFQHVQTKKATPFCISNPISLLLFGFTVFPQTQIQFYTNKSCLSPNQQYDIFNNNFLYCQKNVVDNVKSLKSFTVQN